MPVGRPKRKSDLIMVQSGPSPWPRGKDTTHPPRQNFTSAYVDTRPDAITVPIAAPATPNAGMGPAPRISSTLSTMFKIVIAMPTIIGVRASPAERRAPPSMKKTSMPLLYMNMIRRNGSGSAFTAGGGVLMVRGRGGGEDTVWGGGEE